MKNPPPGIGNARVIRWSHIDSRHQPTGACRHTVAGKLQGVFGGLAICQYPGEKDYYLLYCDADWNEITDGWHQTLEDALRQAEFEYKGIGKTWNVV